MLIVSNPPHRPGDRSAAVWCFDISPLEVAAKAAYPIPEIWFADSDRGVLAEISRVLEAVGLNALWVREEELAAVPEPIRIERVTSDERGLLLTHGSSQKLLRHSTDMRAVVCRPAGSAMREPGPGADVDLEMATFVDIYFLDGGVAHRYSVVDGLVDLSALDCDGGEGAATVMDFVEVCERRFPRARIDRRLVGTRVRRRRTQATLRSAAERRAGFSFGTKRLQTLLESISTDLADITQSDLASRLIYLALR